MSQAEVIEKLKKKGIDLDNNRFLILQGEVEQISLMKPKAPNENEDGLLEFLEDIIGTNKYMEPIAQATKLVEDLSEQRNEKMQRVKAAEREKDNLEGAKNEAEEYLHKKRQICVNYYNLYQLYEDKSSRSIESSKTKREQLQQKLDEFKKDRTGLEKDENTLKSEYKKEKDSCDEMEKELTKTKSEWTAFERKDAQLKQDRVNSKQKKKKLEASLEEATNKCEELRKKITKSQKDETQCQELLDKLTPELQHAEYTLEQLYKSVQKEVEPFRVQVEAKQKEMLPWSKKVNEVKQKINVAQSEIDLINQKTETVKKEITEKKEQLAAAEKQLQEKSATKDKLQKAFTQAQKRIPDMKKELKAVIEEEDLLEKAYQQCRSKFEVLKESASTVKNQNTLLQSLMDAKDEGLISGIQDRLGNLGTIDKKYDVAISTACRALDNIVVDTSASAKQCVDYLHKNNLGYATFIMLDKLKNSIPADKVSSKIETPEKVPRLYDLIKVKDEKFKIAFYFGIRDTLVAENLDQAMRIAYSGSNQWRVVTLKGELIEMTGTMSGGGNQVSKGGMSASLQSDVSSKDIKHAEKQTEQSSKDWKDKSARRANITAQLKAVEEELSTLELDLSKTKLDEEALSTKVNDLQQRINELSAQAGKKDKDQQRIKELDDIIKTYKKSVSEAETRNDSLDAEIKELEEKIDQAGGGQIKQMKQKAEVLTQKIDETNAKLTKSQVQRESAEKSIKKLEKQVEKEKKEVEEVSELCVKLKAEHDELFEKAKDVKSNYDKAQEIMDAKIKDLEVKERAYEALKQRVDKIREAEVESKNKLEDLDRIITEHTKKTTTWSKKMIEMEKQLKDLEDDDESSVEEPAPQPPQEDQPAGDAMETEEEQQQQPATESQNRNKKIRIRKLAREELDKLNEEEIKYRLTILESEIEKMKPNMSAIQNYRQKEKEYNGKKDELDKITTDRNSAQRSYDDLRRKRLTEFMQGFTQISMKLKEIYQMITLGGDAELELVDSLDPFSGIVFSVRPPKKTWKNICNLSGGEKTLSSLSLIFALHHYKPTPIYVMDEIDAALDFKNVSIVGNYIKERTKNAQFLIISLRNNMFELADILVGIYKTHNCTKSVTVNPHLVSIPAATTSDVILDKSKANASQKQPLAPVNQNVL